MKFIRTLVVLALSTLLTPLQAQSVRLKDLGKLSSWREHALVGYGLVTGLAGTGDSPRNQATRQSLANMLARFDLTLSADDVSSRNVAAVMVTASLPAFARAGDAVDVTVTSVGDARSLAGGTLVLAPLKAANNRIYALAQGAISVGGYRYDANGNQVQKNHPTVGTVPGGAHVEVGIAGDAQAVNDLTFVLRDPDYTTASRIAEAINARIGDGVARVRDAAGVDVAVPVQSRDNIALLMTALEEISIKPDHRARVVINERTGTVVTGGDTRIERVAVSHGDLKVSVKTENAVSQPLLIRQTGPGVASVPYSNTQISVTPEASTFVAADNNTVADLVQALARMHVSTRDVISILQAVKAAGALHAELVVQ